MITLTIAGSAKGCPGPGAYTAILSCNGKEKIIDGRDPVTNEATMKMKAFVMGIMALKKDGLEIELHTDSKDIMHVLDNAKAYYHSGWRKKTGAAIPNRGLWMELTQLKAEHKHKITGVYMELDETLSRARQMAIEKAEREAEHGLHGL